MTVFVLTRRMLGSWQRALFITASFGLATMAPAYSRQVNNHIALLTVLCLLFLALDRVVSSGRASRSGESATRAPNAVGWLTVGALTGIGYTIDQGVGPVLWLSMLVCTMSFRTGPSRPPVLCSRRASPSSSRITP